MQTYQKRWYGLAFLSISLLVVSINDTILAVALPSIARELGSSASQLQWLADAYILVFASLLLTMGALSDRFGRRRVLQIGVIFFALCSLLAGLARSSELLIAARGLQGIGAAIIFPSTLSLITVMFREPRERAKAIGIWSAMFGLGVGIGPLLGGWLVVNFHWSAAFFVNIPFALVAVAGNQVFLAESRDKNASRPDVPGVAMSSVGLLALVYSLIEAGTAGWTAPHVLLGFVIFLVLLVAFLWWESHYQYAMLPLYLFKNPSFSGANLAMMMSLFGLMGAMFYIPQFLQGIQGYSPLEAALRLLPQAAFSVIISLLSPRIVRALGIKWTVSGGFLVAATGMLLFALFLQPQLGYVLLLGLLMLMFMGIDAALPAATMSIMGSVPPSKAGVGSGMNEMAGQIGGALGIATLGSLLNNVYLRDVAVLQADLSQEMLAGVSNSIFSAHQAADQLPQALEQLVITVADQAFVSGMSKAMAIGAAALLAVAVITAVVLPSEIMETPEPVSDSKRSS